MVVSMAIEGSDFMRLVAVTWAVDEFADQVLLLGDEGDAGDEAEVRLCPWECRRGPIGCGRNRS